MNANLFKTIQCNAGSTIFREGDQGDCAYVIVSGEVAVRKTADGNEINIAKLGANQLIGEMALLSPGHRTATLIALTDCELLLLDQSQFARRRQNQDPIIRMVFDVILNRFRNTLNSLGKIEDAFDVQPSTTRDMEKAMSQLTFETDIGRGIEAGEFDLHFQPIISLKTGKISGAEGLIRWQHPEKGMIYPTDFIELAEAGDLILRLTQVALDTTFSNHSRFREAAAQSAGGSDDFFLTLNVSGRDLDHEPFYQSVHERLAHYAPAPGSIKLEVTETSLMNDIEKTCERLLALREAGVRIAIDDFGTGYSSMSYLSKLPLSTLKIDRSFVNGVTEQPNSQKITSTILTLAQELGLDVVGEGIECVSDADFLLEKNCTYGQGYLYSKALPANQLVALIQQWRPGEAEAEFPEMFHQMAI